MTRAGNALGCGKVMIALNASGAAVRVVAVGNPSDRLANDLDGRLAHLLGLEAPCRSPVSGFERVFPLNRRNLP